MRKLKYYLKVEEERRQKLREEEEARKHEGNHYYFVFPEYIEAGACVLFFMSVLKGLHNTFLSVYLIKFHPSGHDFIFDPIPCILFFLH